MRRISWTESGLPSDSIAFRIARCWHVSRRVKGLLPMRYKVLRVFKATAIFAMSQAEAADSCR